jgi:hypothetical protein
MQNIPEIWRALQLSLPLQRQTDKNNETIKVYEKESF